MQLVILNKIYLSIGMPMCGTPSIDDRSDTVIFFVSPCLINFASDYAVTMVEEN
jgi:putative hemolysin